MNAQSLCPVLLLLAAAPLGAQQVERALPPRTRVQIEREAQPERLMKVLLDRRPRLGVTVSLRAGDTDSIGALVQSVTPGGPAAKAGIRTGDIITRLDGTTLVDRDAKRAMTDDDQSGPGLRLVELAARLSPDDTISVDLRRGKERRTVRLVTEGESGSTFAYTVPGEMWKQSMGDSERTLVRRFSEKAARAPFYMGELGPAGEGRMRVFFGSPLGDLELAPVNDDLGSYFGTSDGVLVINVPKDSKLNLKSGDVILSVDGRKPSSPPHLMRILQSYDQGETVKLEVMRNHRRETVTGKLE
ncbi:MAG TPA: PDZ domain-containing protein [Gemmatimonadales bacterium]|jgi:S1-C subfamily serine protease|nr:PDZ domain-containing protein [Gemmatimonadales bacterium]